MAASVRRSTAANAIQWVEYEFDDWVQNGAATESIKLVDKGKGSVKGKQVSQILMMNPNIENLMLSRLSGMNDAETASLAEALALDTHLKHLHISHCTIGDAGATALGVALANNPSLEHLELQENGGNLGKPLAQALSTNRALKRLVYHGSMSKDEAKMLGESLSKNTSLQQLEIVCKRTLIGDDGAAAILSALKTNATLDRLCLPGSAAGDRTAQELGDALKRNTSLLYIDLSGNKIGDKGAKSIADGLPANSTMLHLDLSRNKFGQCGAYFLAGGLAANTGLKGFIVKYADVGPDASTALSEALAANTSLQYMDLGMCKINDDGAKCLATGLMSNSTMMGLNLEMNNIGNAGVASLEECLSLNATIKVLNVVGNPADESVRKALQAKAAAARQVAGHAGVSESEKNISNVSQSAIHPSSPSSGSLTSTARTLSVGAGPRQLTGAQLDACKGDRIGGGGFGSVYMGTLDSAPVVVKIVEAEGLASFADYEREAAVLAVARHPYIVQLFATCDERRALVMEHMAGGSLQDALDDGKMPWFSRVRVLHESCIGLQFLHNQQPAILHRDIKPSNILLSSDMRAKLGDVGLAKVADSSARLTRTMSSVVTGTLHYLDPAYQRTGTYTPESDVYSLGLTIAVTVTNEAPVGMDGLLRDAMDDGTLGDLVDTRPGTCGWDLPVATTLLELASKCLKSNPAKRPTLSDIAAQLEGMAAEASAAMAISSASGGFTEGMKDSMKALLSCPITYKVMADPVVAEDGFTYERTAIEAHLKSSSKSPLTNVPMGPRLIPNRNMKIMLAQFTAMFGT